VKPTAVVGRHGARKTRVASSRRLHVCQRALWRGVGLVVVCGGEHLRIAQKPRAARAAGKRKQRGEKFAFVLRIADQHWHLRVRAAIRVTNQTAVAFRLTVVQRLLQSIELLTRQPTMRRANTSITKATYSQPCHVDT
jgi:hypothetical protein